MASPDGSREARLDAAVALRESGQLEEARQMLLGLYDESPHDPHVNLQCAWVHDLMGLERDALGFYEDAVNLGLEGDDLREALHGLGSTLRCLGEYQRAIEVLRRGAREFPASKEFGPFLAMACAEAGECRYAVGLLLRDLAQTSSDPDIIRYRRALLSYAQEFIGEEAL